jgi:hypothetical protein
MRKRSTGSNGAARSTQEPGKTPERDTECILSAGWRSRGGESRTTGHQDRDRPDDGAAKATPPEVDRNAKSASITCMAGCK